MFIRKIALYTLLSLAIPIASYSQVSIRHLGSITEAKVGYLLSNSGSGAEIGGNYYFSNKIYYQGVISFEKGSVGLLNYQKTSFINSANYNALSLSDKFFIDPRTGFLVAYDYAYSDAESGTEEGIIYGGYFGVALKYYFNNRLALYFNANQFVTTSKIGGKNTSLTFGLIYTINKKSYE